MKQIYNFEQQEPPILNENMLRRELEKRTLQKQTAMLTLAVILSQAAMILLGVFTLEIYPVIAATCFLYSLMTTVGSGIIAVIYTKKED